jgi:hypothetical protein
MIHWGMDLLWVSVFIYDIGVVEPARVVLICG